MDAFRFAIAAVPLAAYLLVVGLINLRRQPLVVTGLADFAAVGAALSGVALIGPLALFRPDEASAQMGPWIWVLLLVLYWLWVALLTMLSRPRLVIYNRTATQLRPVLSDVARQLDPQARWAGEGLALPTLGVQLHMDSHTWLRNTSLIASGGEQDLDGWRRLAKATQRALRGPEATAGSHGYTMVVAGALLVGVAMLRLASDPEGVAVAWQRSLTL